MEAPIEIGASIREKGRMSSIGYLFGQLGLLVDLHLEGEHQADSTVRGCCVAHFFLLL